MNPWGWRQSPWSAVSTAMPDRPADRMNNLGRGVDIDPTAHCCLTTLSRHGSETLGVRHTVKDAALELPDNREEQEIKAF